MIPAPTASLPDSYPAWRKPALRDPVNGLLHFAGLLASLAGTAVLVYACRADALKMLTAAIFGLSMCGCFMGSTLHHLVSGSRRTEMWLLKLDHAAIYPFIAGSYTPVCVHVLPGKGAIALLGVVWALAIAGMVYKLRFAPDPATVEEPPGFIDTVLYIAMGWLAAFQAPQIIAYSKEMTLQLALLGGMAYSIGAIILTRKYFDFWPGRFGHHEVWHLCVLLGASLVYAYVFLNIV